MFRKISFNFKDKKSTADDLKSEKSAVTATTKASTVESQTDFFSKLQELDKSTLGQSTVKV